jgi:hypothetical protein
MAKPKTERPVSGEFAPTAAQFKVLQKVGVHFSRAELKELEKMLNDPKTLLSRGPGSAAYHR